MENKNTTVLKKRNALGRGLGALLQDNSEVTPPEEVRQQTSVQDIDINIIEVNPYQPRTHFDVEALEELAESIRVQGIIQPITVRQLSAEQYQLISGERRLQASKMAGLTRIPAYIRTANDQQMLELALIENIQRENLNSIEIALSYQRLISECNLKQEELGDRVGKNRATVNNYIRLLKLPDIIQVALRDNKISMGHARAIINIENIDTKLAVFKKIMEEDLSVRKVEDIVRNLGNSSMSNKKIKHAGKQEVRVELQQLQTKLSSYFGTKIEIRSSDKTKGEIKIPFHSEDDLNRLLEIFNV